MPLARRSCFAALPALLAALAGSVLAAASPLSAQEFDLTAVPEVPRDYRPALTSWGEPDLRGTWPLDHLKFTPLQRPPEQASRYWLTEAEWAARSKVLTERGQSNMRIVDDASAAAPKSVTASRRTSFVIDPPDGRLPPVTEEARRRAAPRGSSWVADQAYGWVDDFDIWDRCISRGLPASMFPFFYNNGMRVFQSPGMVSIQLEMVHETRIIPTDGRAGVPAGIHNWLGESRGHWENSNTLVVETTGFIEDSSPVNVGTPGSPPGNNTAQSTEAKLTERFTITGPDTVTYEATYSDPVIFTAPWTARLEWQRDEAYQLFEYACHEGNANIRGFITTSRGQRELLKQEQPQ